MRTFVALVLTCFLLLAGCGGEAGDSTGGASGCPAPSPAASSEAAESPSQSLTVDGRDPRENLANARRMWEQNGPDRYRWTVQRMCFCPVLHLRITVEDGAATDITSLAGKLPDTEQ